MVDYKHCKIIIVLIHHVTLHVSRHKNFFLYIQKYINTNIIFNF